MQPNMIEVYVTPFGQVRLTDLPKGICKVLSEAPKRKDGRFDMRFKASREAAEVEKKVDQILQERWEKADLTRSEK